MDLIVSSVSVKGPGKGREIPDRLLGLLIRGWLVMEVNMKNQWEGISMGTSVFYNTRDPSWVS